MPSALQENHGYKKTELSWIPEDWDVKFFDEIIDVLTDYTANGSFASLATNVKICNVPNYALWIMAKTLKKGNYTENMQYTNQKGYDFLKKTSLFGGELLMPKTGGLGEAYIFPKLNQKATLADNVFLIKPTNNIFETFLFYYLNSPLFKQQLNKMVYGTSQQTIVKKELRKIPIAVPSLIEQRRIAEILISVDEKIEKIDTQIKQAEQLKKALMQELLTKGIGHTKFKKTELGYIPEKWRIAKLCEFIIEHKGGAPLTPSDFREEGFKIIPKKGVAKGGYLKISEDEQAYCSKEFASKYSSCIINKKYLITVLRDLVPSGPSIGLIVKYNSNSEYILAQGVYGFKVKSELCSDFLIHYSNTDTYRKLMQTIMVGSTQVHIRNNDFFGINLPLPQFKEQQKIAEILCSADEKIEILQNKKSEYEKLKKGLMQKLLTGQIRVRI